MAEAPDQPDAKRFKHEEHDVTCCCEYLFCGNTKLILGEEEAELIKSSCCGICNTKKRSPYGEIGSVDSDFTCCFYGFGAASLMPAGQATQCTGLGCEQDKVNSLVAELKKRQEMRGDRAKVRLAETTVESLNELHQKMDMVMDHLQLKLSPKQEMVRD